MVSDWWLCFGSTIWTDDARYGDGPLSDSLSREVGSAGDEALRLVAAAARGADEKLGINPVALNVGDLLSVVEYFLVVSGRNERQTHAICDAVEEKVKSDCGRSPIRIEGLREGTWILMDYGDVVIHIFEEEARSFYDLEHLWNAAPRISLAEFSSVNADD